MNSLQLSLRHVERAHVAEHARKSPPQLCIVGIPVDLRLQAVELRLHLFDARIVEGSLQLVALARRYPMPPPKRPADCRGSDDYDGRNSCCRWLSRGFSAWCNGCSPAAGRGGGGGGAIVHGD